MLRCEQASRFGTWFYHVEDGYYYKYEHAREHSAYFRCRSAHCPGRALFRTNGLFETTQPHNHAPDLLYSQVQAARRTILDRARSLRYVSFAEIIRQERSRLQNRAVRSYLTLRRLRPAMIRNRRQIFPNIPEDLTGLTAILRDPAWQWLTNTTDFSDSLYLGSTWGADGSHSVVFMSLRCLQIMRLTSIIFADGTFYITPSVAGCYQIFTLVTITPSHAVIPLCWCIMESKTEHAYVSVLLLIRQHLGFWNFTQVISDFEDAIVNAFRIVFQIQVQGCYFHATNAMGKHARLTIGVTILNTMSDVRSVVRLCCTLPLLPQHLIQRGFDLICGAAVANINFLVFICYVWPYLQYIQFDWILHGTRGQTLSVCGSLHRTNNASESNNRRMKRCVGVHHPNIYHFIRQLAEFEDNAIDDYNSVNGALPSNRHRDLVTVSSDANIQAITAELLQINDPTDNHILRFMTLAALTVDDILHEVLAAI